MNERAFQAPRQEKQRDDIAATAVRVDLNQAPKPIRRQQINRARGEDHGRHKLTAKEVAEIRAVPIKQHGSGRRLARKYDVSPAIISRIRNNKRWKQ